MATQDVQKFPGPTPTVELDITPPAYDPNEPDPAVRFIAQQWRDADKQGLGKTHPKSINTDTSYA